MSASPADRQLSVSVTYGEVHVNFTGPPEVVFRSLHEFIAKEIPNIDLAKSITVSYSLNDLIQMFKDYIKFTEEGPRVWIEDKKLSDKDYVTLQLVAARAANLSGKSATDDMNVSELQAATNLLAKTIGSRLSELNKSGAVDRRDAGEGGIGRYRITTTGVHWLYGQLQKKYPKPSAQSAATAAG